MISVVRLLLLFMVATLAGQTWGTVAPSLGIYGYDATTHPIVEAGVISGQQKRTYGAYRILPDNSYKTNTSSRSDNLHNGYFFESVSDFLATKWGVDNLLKAGQQLDRNGLTKAGRALQKHSDRPGTAFPKSTGNATTRNQQGQDILDGILRSGNKTSNSNRFGGKDIFDNNTGRGVRFDGDGNMKGFLEP